MTNEGFWQNRIVESGAANPQELAKGMNPLNWRGHPESQREALEEALDSIGFLQRVLVNRVTGRVIDGHLRIELAVLKGQPLIPVDYVELTEDEEALALATLDAITEQAEPIPDKLAQLLERTRELTADRPGLAAMMDRLRAMSMSSAGPIGFDNSPSNTRDESVWNKLSFSGKTIKFEFGEFRCLLPVEIYQELFSLKPDNGITNADFITSVIKQGCNAQNISN